jgi:hypothetical protein
MPLTSTSPNQIAQLNDRFRRNGLGKGMRVITPGIAAMPLHDQLAIMARVAGFDAFTEGNDTHGEHDFGCFDLGGTRIFWKIDAYSDQQLDSAAKDPTDPSAFRVLTVMLASEY